MYQGSANYSHRKPDSEKDQLENVDPGKDVIEPGKDYVDSVECQDGIQNYTESENEASGSAPYYRALLQEHDKVKEELRILKDENIKLVGERRGEKEKWEKDVQEREQRIAAFTKEKCDVQNQNERNRLELQHRLEVLQRQCDVANRERETIVVKFAQREHTTMKLEQQKEVLEKRLIDFGRERDSLLLKVKALNGEKSRACDLADQKSSELLSIKREISLLKEELNSRDARIRISESKLKDERDANKEAQSRFDRISQRVKEQKEEFDLKLRDLQESLRSLQTTEANKVVLADEQRMEHRAKMIVEKQQKEQEQSVCKQLTKEIEMLRGHQLILVQDNSRLVSQVESLTSDRLQVEESVEKLRLNLQELELLRSCSLSQLSELEALKLEIAIEREQCKNLKSDVVLITEINVELREESELCRRKESEALDFTRKLTETNVQLQSDLTVADAKAETCQKECKKLLTELNLVRAELSKQQQLLQSEVEKRQHETQLLASKLAEKTLEVEALKMDVNDLSGEMAIMKKKHASTLKEMSKEMTRARRKVDGVESVSNHSSGDAISLGSRASSNTSLNTVGLHPAEVARLTSHSPINGHKSTAEENGYILNFDELSDKQQFFVDKILKQQRSNARKSEKIDFLEEHVRTLTEEVRKKNRILLCYFMKQEAGGLTSERSDRAKVEMAKHGGVMASVYSSRVSDGTMSLDLSLEINRKLQALLEDTLLKNITLKESLNTLGEEIARLSQEHQTLLKSRS